MQSAPDSNEDDPTLFCKELKGPSAGSTILLIHGAFSSGTEWDLVIPYLFDSYHVLIPDLPAHGGSKDTGPFTKELSARLLATVIREKGLDGKAHVVGTSLGAHVAIELASKYPQVVETCFVSGYEVFESAQNITYGLWLENRIQSAIPQSLVRWLMDGIDVPRSTRSISACRAVADTLCINDEDWPAPWPARTLVVAAGKSGILPTGDHPHDAVRLRDIGQKSNAKTSAYIHPDMRHPWNRQAPELFAQTAKMWLEQAKVPDGFKEL